MSDEEWEQPRQKRMRVYVPVDGASDDIKVDDLDVEIDCSVESESSIFDESMDELEDEMSGLEEIEDKSDYFESGSDGNESEEMNTDWSDPDEKVVSEHFEDDYEPINSDEKEICDFIDQVLNGELPSDYSKEWPTVYLQQDKKSEVMSEKQFQTYINEKFSLTLLNKCSLGFEYHSNNAFSEQLDYWKQKLEKLDKKIRKLKNFVVNIPLMPPPPDIIYHVRNVGVQVNMLPELSLKNLPKFVPSNC